jgi:uncharacterized membrane protein
MKRVTVRPVSPFISAIMASMLASVGFFVFGAWQKNGLGYWYLLWNLFLAWIPLMLAQLLVRLLEHNAWSSWRGIGLSLLWLLFLPNSFYMVTDYIHLTDVASDDLLYYAVTFTSFILNGLILGYLSMYLVHRELRKRLPQANAMRTMLGVILLCSIAIYIGRDLRWNTWDVLLNPGGILFALSNRMLSPATYPAMVVTVVSFFVFIASFYFVVRRMLIGLLATQQK